MEPMQIDELEQEGLDAPSSSQPPSTSQLSGSTVNSQNGDGGRAAAVYELPRRELLCVEYPAHVRNVDRAITTLGGTHTLHKAFKEKAKFLEMRFRPDDVYAHPIYGDFMMGSSLLLKVTRPKTIPTQASSTLPVPFKTEMVGSITSLYQFKGMADFQYVPPAEVVIKEQKGAFHLMTQKWMEDDEPLHLPPPIFSKVDISQNYRFLANPLFKITQEKNEKGEDKKRFERVTRRKQTGISRVPQVSYDDKEIPAPPSAEEAQERRGKDGHALESCLRLLFEQRPIWSTTALRANIPPEQLSKLKRVIPLVAYHFRAGPWRKMWIRYGYDPRQERDARVYQVLDFRCAPEQTRSQGEKPGVKRAPLRLRRHLRLDVSNLIEVESSEALLGQAGDTATREWWAQEYTFNVPPSSQQKLYQLCDIDDPRIQKIVHDSHSTTPTLQKHDGWYRREALDSIRRLMNERLATLLAKEGTPTRSEHEPPPPPHEQQQQHGPEEEDQTTTTTTTVMMVMPLGSSGGGGGQQPPSFLASLLTGQQQREEEEETPHEQQQMQMQKSFLEDLLHTTDEQDLVPYYDEDEEDDEDVEDVEDNDVDDAEDDDDQDLNDNEENESSDAAEDGAAP